MPDYRDGFHDAVKIGAEQIRKDLLKRIQFGTVPDDILRRGIIWCPGDIHDQKGEQGSVRVMFWFVLSEFLDDLIYIGADYK